MVTYMGSKARIAKFIKPFLNKELITNKYDAYIEPFVGGANMIEQIKYKKKIASDNNKYMIALFNGLKAGRRISKFYSKEEYYKMKSKLDLYDDFEIAWVMLFYSFNGRFKSSYGGKRREYTTGKIKYRLDANSSIKSAIRQVQKLKEVDFYYRDYTFYKDFSNCVFYLDPPYFSTAGYSTEAFNHTKFWQFTRNLSKENKVFISEYNAPDDFKILWENNINFVNLSGKKAGIVTDRKKTEKLYRLKA